MEDFRAALETIIRTRLENAALLRRMSLSAKRRPRHGDERLQRIERALEALPEAMDRLVVRRRSAGRAFTLEELLNILAPE